MVTIILPVYNAEKYLRKCLDSVVSQSFSDMEVILVDDGSKDVSPEICDEYAEKDKRIKVIHKVNAGASAARNDGIDAATGDYITFLDADDWIDTDYIETLMEYKDYPLVIAGFKYFGVKKYSKGPKESKEVKVSTDIPKIWAQRSNAYFWFVWGKLYRRDVIVGNSIHFNQSMKYLEDFCFVLEYLSHIDTLFLVNCFKVHHLVEEEKYLRYRMDFQNFKNHMEIHDRYFKMLEKKCNCTFGAMRSLISNRHFYNFAEFVLYSDAPFRVRLKNIKQYRSEENKSLYSFVNIKKIKKYGIKERFYWNAMSMMSLIV